MKKNANQVLRSFLSMRKDFHRDNGHSLVLDQKRSGTLSVKTVHKENGTIWRKGDRIADTQFSVPRVRCPEERSKAKVVENCQFTSVPVVRRLILFFRTIISVNQLSIYGAVSDLSEECKTCHVRTGRPVVAGQSNPLFVPSVMKTHI